jgi:hypothetical protein
MADLLRHLDPEDPDGIRGSFARRFDGHADSYRGQPPEIRALMSSRGNVDLYFLSTHKVLERACEADPSAENFQRWLRHAEEAAPATCDLVAERWSAALPDDISPLLRLMQSAERRNALQKAFKFMERAERIDGLNAEVRRARLRLLVSMVVRHLREKKPKLAEKDLSQIEALPQSKQGDRPAFVAALRFVWRLLRNEKQEAVSAHAEAVRFLGDEVSAQLLFLHVERWCGRPASALGHAPPPTVPLFAALGRVCALGDDMGLAAGLTDAIQGQLMIELSAATLSANPRILAALGEAAMREDRFPLAFVIAGAGLSQGPESQARFLFLRARSLPPWEEDRRSSCFAAASDMARRQHDSSLLERMGEWRDESLGWLDTPDRAQAAMSAEDLGRVVERETRERAYPTSPPDLGDADEDCQCSACCAARGEEMPPELAEMLDQFGPDALMEALAGILGGGKKGRGRRRPHLDDSDLPF